MTARLGPAAARRRESLAVVVAQTTTGVCVGELGDFAAEVAHGNVGAGEVEEASAFDLVGVADEDEPDGGGCFLGGGFGAEAGEFGEEVFAGGFAGVAGGFGAVEGGEVVGGDAVAFGEGEGELAEEGFVGGVVFGVAGVAGDDADFWGWVGGGQSGEEGGCEKQE